VTPGARYAAAMDVLDAVVGGSPAERELTRWARASRFAGSRDRAAVRDIVYGCLRRRRSCLWRAGQEAETGRALVLGWILSTDPGDLALLDGEGYAAPPPTDPERAAFRDDLSGAPAPVALDYPDAMGKILEKSLGDALPRVMAVLQERAPIDLRVNLLKTDPITARAALAAEGIVCAPVDRVATALRVTEAARQVAGSAAYRRGEVELQDAASQLVALSSGVTGGQKVLDMCAGGGGKTLALGAMMQGRGLISAYDIDPARMKDLPGRARRSGVEIEILDTRTLDSRSRFYDVVLVDAPCSGTGAWRRNPDHKWRLSGADLRRLEAVQAQILERVLGYLAPGGTLVYATCSMLEPENSGQIASFRARHPNVDLCEETRLLPGDVGDGFYLCVMKVP